MISKTIITDKSARFLSEVINEIPSQCFLNKGVTGCGGTTLEIQSKRDSIILVPNINLVLNKTRVVLRSTPSFILENVSFAKKSEEIKYSSLSIGIKYS